MPWPRTTAFAALALGLSSLGAAQTINLPAGDEGFIWYDSVRQELTRSSMSFAGMPLPGTLAGVNYADFAETIDLVGRPVATLPSGGLNNVSLIVRRTASTGPMALGSSVLVPADIAALNLASKTPLVFQPSPTAPPGTPPKLLDLHVRIATVGPPTSGHAFLTMDHAEGGTIHYAVTTYLEFELFDGALSVGTLGPVGPIDFETPTMPWWSTAGAIYVGSGLVDGAPVPAGLALDSDDDGLPDDLTWGGTGSVTTAGMLNGQLTWSQTFRMSSDTLEMRSAFVKGLGDRDSDSWADIVDNCPLTYNPPQLDADLDGIGDKCDFGVGRAPRVNEAVFGSFGNPELPFVELIGAPGASLAGFVLAVVDGDASDAGQLDRVIDLGGQTIPSNGLFVVGEPGGPNVDLAVPGGLGFESGTQTVLVLEAASVGLIKALSGSDVDPDGDGLTDLRSYCTYVVDAVCVWDGWRSARAFDGAGFHALGQANGSAFLSLAPIGVRPHGLLRTTTSTGRVGLWRRGAHVRRSPSHWWDLPSTPGMPNP